MSKRILESERRELFRSGVRAAASVAGDFDAQIDHPWKMEDVILCKFNLLPKEKMRRNYSPVTARQALRKARTPARQEGRDK